ncbi:MAG: nucleoside deaminase [Bdellovibrionales bacterium]|nr:nucleoside deaminase [Bdellovibrionales bacterium]
MAEDELYITETFKIAKAAVAKGNHPFGALLVYNNEVVATAENTVALELDCTCHAELSLVRKVQKIMNKQSLADSVLYTSTEPCAMCAGAIYWSGIKKVVFGCSARKLREIAGKSLDISARDVYLGSADIVEVVGPVLEEEGAEIHREFWANRIQVK